MLEFYVVEGMNGYVIYEGNPYNRDITTRNKSWVATDATNLGFVMERLAQGREAELIAGQKKTPPTPEKVSDVGEVEAPKEYRPVKNKY